MVELDAVPDPGDSDWDDRVEEFVEGTDVETSLGKRLLKDAYRVTRGELTPEEFGGRYPTRAVQSLGVDEKLSRYTQKEASREQNLPVDYSQPDTGETGAERASKDGCGSGCTCNCRDEGPERESVLDRDFTPEEALERTIPEDLFPDIEDTTSMEDLGQNWGMDDIDDEWEANARADLRDVEFGTELGIEMSRDALRIAQGDLSKATFHEKYNDRVLQEFGIDHRPTRHAEPPAESHDGPDTDSSASSEKTGDGLPSVPGQDGVGTSRRQFMKGATAAAAGTTAAVAGCLDSDIAQQGTDPASHDGDVQMGMAIDLEQCIGCLLCAEGCMEENNTDLGAFWMHVFRFEEDEKGDSVENYMPRPCQHCSEPSCSYVCPTQARYKRDEDGLVLTNYDTCIGCKYCQVACPYGVNYLGKDDSSDKSPGFWHPTSGSDDIETAGPPPNGVMGKCTFCAHRQDEKTSRGTTACEDACPVDAIHFGDLEDADSDPRQHMREKRAMSRFNLLEGQGNEPNIVYLGDEPSGRAESVDGPFTYRDLGMEPLGEPANSSTEGGDDE